MNSLLPPEIVDASVWYGPEIAHRDEWIVRLTETEIAEIQAAVEKHQSASDVHELPSLTPKLLTILEDVINGRGFVLIKGLPVERWTRREAAIAFLIIGMQLGNCGCRMPTDICSDMCGIWGVRATIRTREFIRRVNVKHITLTPAMSLDCCVYKLLRLVVCRVWFRPQRSSTRCVVVDQIY